ncbi:MAG: DUF3473 domain-containing protein [Desulfuromonadales bacterium]|nr:DUF3473 domain-containing protein [Desulfuromonadales bacterium]
MRNAFTVDVEDFFQVAAFRRQVAVEQWPQFTLRVVDNTLRVLDWMECRQILGTFFVLGWVAERAPALVREILHRGHEVASHGYGHQLIYEIGPDRFRLDVRRARQILEDAGGEKICGYRAPSYSITARSLWALDILIEEGFTWDSSIYPIIHDLYGIPGGNRFLHWIQRPAGQIREFPITTYELRLARARVRLPVGGGGYLRLLPAPWIRRAFEKINQEEGQPAILYFHPWEIDPQQPRIQAPWRSRFRHYLNLERTFGKLDYLVRHLPFAPVREVLAAVEGQERTAFRCHGVAHA